MPASKNIYALAAYELCLPAVEAASYELLEVNFRQEQGERYLTFVIDKRGGISIEDCEAVNNIVEPLLDANEIISGAYNLEVSSAGLDRPLQTEADFKRYIDSEVEVSCYRKYLNCKQFIGYLLDYNAGELTIDLDLLAMQKQMDKKTFKEFLFNLQVELEGESWNAKTETERKTAWRKFKVQSLLESEEPLQLSFADQEWSCVKRYIDFN